MSHIAGHMAEDRMHRLFLRTVAPGDLSGFTALNAGELTALRDIAYAHNMLALVYTRLRKLSGNSADIGKFLEDGKSYLLRTAALSARQETLERSVQSLLMRDGVRSVLMRGNAIARDIYLDPNCRTSSDIDILVEKDCIPKAASILTEAGYSTDASMPPAYCFSRIHHATFYSPGEEMPVEIHWLFGLPYFFDVSSAEIWKGVVCGDGGECRLSPEMHMIMLLVHHHSHSFRQLKILTDILWAMNSYDSVIDWQGFASRLKRAGLMKTARITLSQIEPLWGGTANGPAAVEILSGALDRIGCRIPGALEAYFRPDMTKDYRSTVYSDKLIARLALDNRGTIIRSFGKTLFPEPRAIKELYGDNRNWTLPINYSRFIAWRLEAWKKGTAEG